MDGTVQRIRDISAAQGRASPLDSAMLGSRATLERDAVLDGACSRKVTPCFTE